MYWLFAPIEQRPSKGASLFEGIPIVSFAAILFPQLNQQLPEKITQAFGWFGLISLSIILLIFIIYVW
ncbi:hypothetical protein [uncultured Shewanella sp.]|uniref:hypothetical protein n=1 Tax=uncultured Shewanella sp. TaxID=173975 RepID=UPI00260CE5C6|nr:hypothetical protein [uncultured Shewanella sp.]